MGPGELDFQQRVSCFIKGVMMVPFVKLILFPYWLCWVSAAAQTLLQLGRAEVVLCLWFAGFSLHWFVLSQSTASRAHGLQ